MASLNHLGRSYLFGKFDACDHQLLCARSWLPNWGFHLEARHEKVFALSLGEAAIAVAAASAISAYAFATFWTIPQKLDFGQRNVTVDPIPARWC